MKNYDILDITKLILCLMVVAIHTELFPMVLYPWLLLAVPLFFIISSYLLYTKINILPKEDRNNMIKKYILRLVKYYLFWFILLLPATMLARREWFDNGIVNGILLFIKNLFLGATFKASWYITATIFGTIIVEKLSIKFNSKILIPLFIFAYIICCCTSSYYFIFNKNKIITIISLIIEPHFTFLFSLIYIYAGKLIQEKKLKINKKTNVLLIILSCILLYIEWFTIYKINGTFNKPGYLFIVPTAILVFNYIKDIKIVVKNSKVLRQFSSFTYPLHCSAAGILSFVLKKFIDNEVLRTTTNFILTISICILAFYIVKKLESKINVLKYSH